MLDFISSHWEIIFSGVGTAIVAAVIGFLVKRRRSKEVSHHQQAKAGAHSQIAQAGRDISIGDLPPNKAKK